ncbi:MAG TPA: DUF47 family protein [Natronosporangium sp.]
MRDLTGRTDRALAGLVVEQLTATAAGLALARAAAAGELDIAEARQRMAEVEHQGDASRAALVQRLRRSLTSPIDREDLFRLSRSVDDVLDSLRDFVREFDLFAAEPAELYRPLLDALAAGLEHLTEAVRCLPTHSQDAVRSALAARKQGVRPQYQQAVAELFDRPFAVDTVKAALLLSRLDLAGNSLANAADALADGVMKRFQ